MLIASEVSMLIHFINNEKISRSLWPINSPTEFPFLWAGHDKETWNANVFSTFRLENCSPNSFYLFPPIRSRSLAIVPAICLSLPCRLAYEWHACNEQTKINGQLNESNLLMSLLYGIFFGLIFAVVCVCVCPFLFCADAIYSLHSDLSEHNSDKNQI